jgi:hypothetical protein
MPGWPGPANRRCSVCLPRHFGRGAGHRSSAPVQLTPYFVAIAIRLAVDSIGLRVTAATQ